VLSITIAVVMVLLARFMAWGPKTTRTVSLICSHGTLTISCLRVSAKEMAFDPVRRPGWLLGFFLLNLALLGPQLLRIDEVKTPDFAFTMVLILIAPTVEELIFRG
jgi:membrane protease YdiL (CAAX protease family)